MKKIDKLWILLIFPILILIGEIYLFYTNNWLDEGQSFLYLNAYGQGFFTSWLNFEWFWGNFEFNTIRALVISAIVLVYWPKDPIYHQENFFSLPDGNKIIRIQRGSGIGLGVLLIVGIFFWTTSPGSGINYNAGRILLYGWYPTYFCIHLFECVLFLSGFWVWGILLRSIISKQRLNGWNSFNLLLLVIASGVILHLIAVGSIDPLSLAMLSPVILNNTAFLLVPFPMIIFFLSRIPTSNQRNTFSLKTCILHLGVWGFLNIGIFILLGAIFFRNFLGDDFPVTTGIDISSWWIPSNYMGWIYLVLLTIVLVTTGIRYQIEKSGEKK